jgi:toxin ParE1/3/4
MSLRVVFRRAAARELEDATLWYDAQRAGLGSDFRDAVEHAIALAAEEPLRFPRWHRNVHCARVRRFPYSVFFLPEANRLVVISVFHARRDPQVWQSRA